LIWPHIARLVEPEGDTGDTGAQRVSGNAACAGSSRCDAPARAQHGGGYPRREQKRAQLEQKGSQMHYIRKYWNLGLISLAACQPAEPSSQVERAELGSSEQQLTYTGSCSSGYEHHGVYETTMLFGIDETRSGDAFVDMAPERNTLAYRTAAYQFFSERYGLSFDPDQPGQQFVSDGQGGLAFVWPLALGTGPSHQVHALDAQHIPEWRNLIPVTNLALWNDSYFVFAVTNFRVHGTYGGAAGATVRAGDLLAFGQYRMIDDRGRLLDVITFQGDTPTLLTPFTGDPATSAGAVMVGISAEATSDFLGDGIIRGTGEIRPLADGRLHLDFRYVLRVPGKLDGAAVPHPHCRRVRPLH
jgi:hypothetical protein